MKVAVDAMGGDHAPRAVVTGALQAVQRYRCSVVLVGDEEIVARELERQKRVPEEVEVIHADEVVGMDEPAITPIRRKRRSSIRVCCELVREGRAKAIVTAGNTGAAMISAKMVIGTIDGVDRPALAEVLPNQKGGQTVLLDLGANVDARPSHLLQFAIMGHFWAQEMVGTASPRVGLMSIGAEEGKGTDLTREVFRVMKTTGLNFVGNVEGRDVYNGEVDVVVCDGFVGNVILKTSESLANLFGSMLREELGRSWRSRLGYLLARPAFESFRRRTDYREWGASPLLGLRGGCFIAHGSSNPKAIRNAVRRAAVFCEHDLHNKIREKVAQLHREERRLLSLQSA
ncbi:MAG: phosphate acyltransferase PlsX [Thermoanaerobaculia bacterium]|nr:phosphate acyltransferase PlsX [Thermoanaerobaculia bacterium]